MLRTTRVACGALIAIAIVQPVHAAPVELVQAGDAEMTCQALAAEMNTLSAAKAKAAKRAESGRKLLGFASTALQIASSTGVLGRGGGGQGGYAAQQALGSLQAQAMQQQMQQQLQQGAVAGVGFAGVDPSAVSAQPADTSVEGQRLARLTDLHAQKGC